MLQIMSRLHAQVHVQRRFIRVLRSLHLRRLRWHREPLRQRGRVHRQMRGAKRRRRFCRCCRGCPEDARCLRTAHRQGELPRHEDKVRVGRRFNVLPQSSCCLYLLLQCVSSGLIPGRGLVDLDLSFPLLPGCQATFVLFPPAKTDFVRQWNNQDPSQPNPVSDQIGRHVHLS